MLLSVVALGVLTILLLRTGGRVDGPGLTGLRSSLVPLSAVAGGISVFSTMFGIRHATLRAFESEPRGRQVEALLRLRRLSQRLLTAAGALVALATLAIGASWPVQQSLLGAKLGATGTGLPAQTALMFGCLASLLVAMTYTPTAAALRQRTYLLSAELFPLTDLDAIEDAPAILTQAENQQKLEQLLGADRSPLADLQTGLAILGPLLVSAAAAFIPL